MSSFFFWISRKEKNIQGNDVELHKAIASCEPVVCLNHRKEPNILR